MVLERRQQAPNGVALLNLTSPETSHNDHVVLPELET